MKHVQSQAEDPVQSLIAEHRRFADHIIGELTPEQRSRHTEIARLTDAYAASALKPLDEQYALYAQVMTALLCINNGPAVQGRSRTESWAAGVMHTLGVVNFLTDPSYQPHQTTDDIARAFAVSPATMQAKSREIRDFLEIDEPQFDPTWCLPDLLDENPFIWLRPLKNGIIIDLRMLPDEDMRQAVDAGIIPWIPRNRAEAEGASIEARQTIAAAYRRIGLLREDDVNEDANEDDVDENPGGPVVGRIGGRQSSPPHPQDDRIFTLDVALIAGPVSEDFLKANPTVVRTIQIRGNQTLDILHEAIFTAFDRDEEHMYEFQVGGRKPHDRRARRYSIGFIEPYGDEPAPADAGVTTFASLGLKSRQKLFYWFDFGDDWWHEVRVTKIADADPESGARYPRITERIGASPPQYAFADDWE